MLVCLFIQYKLLGWGLDRMLLIELQCVELLDGKCQLENSVHEVLTEALTSEHINCFEVLNFLALYRTFQHDIRFVGSVEVGHL